MDDTLDQASLIHVENKPQRHNFHVETDDVDWVKFHATAGEQYTIKAQNLNIICDVSIRLYDDQETPLTALENSGGPGQEVRCLRPR